MDDTLHGKVYRRGFLKFGLGTLATGILSSPAFAMAGRLVAPERKLSFYNLHTSEKLSIVYWAEGSYIAESLESINHILRDYRTGEEKNIDRRLLDLLFAIRDKTGTNRPFNIVSGYRSPETNRMLRKNSKNVASSSFHLKGEAADIYLPNVELPKLRRTALSLRGGGVGYYYPDFVHVDVGPIRTWDG